MLLDHFYDPMVTLWRFNIFCNCWPHENKRVLRWFNYNCSLVSAVFLSPPGHRAWGGWAPIWGWTGRTAVTRAAPRVIEGNCEEVHLEVATDLQAHLAAVPDQVQRHPNLKFVINLGWSVAKLSSPKTRKEGISLGWQCWSTGSVWGREGRAWRRPCGWSRPCTCGPPPVCWWSWLRSAQTATHTGSDGRDKYSAKNMIFNFHCQHFCTSYLIWFVSNDPCGDDQ